MTRYFRAWFERNYGKRPCQRREESALWRKHREGVEAYTILQSAQRYDDQQAAAWIGYSAAKQEAQQ